jgi:Delta3,5-Delta2,4-dienoyl-CoA isomerase
MNSKPAYFLLSRPAPYIIHVEINRPSRLNSFFEAMWVELRDVFDNITQDPSVRVVILSGAGEKAFTTGLDVQAAAQSRLVISADGRVAPWNATTFRRYLEHVQDCISAVERCEKRMFVSSFHYRGARLNWRLSLTGVLQPSSVSCMDTL